MRFVALLLLASCAPAKIDGYCITWRAQTQGRCELESGNAMVLHPGQRWCPDGGGCEDVVCVDDGESWDMRLGACDEV
ncbi:MAG: hypothetical protein ACO3CS_19180 [Alphaproteobacteria bacterium]